MLYKPFWPGELNDLLESLKYLFDVCFHTEKEGYKKAGARSVSLTRYKFSDLVFSRRKNWKRNKLLEFGGKHVHRPGTLDGLVTLYLSDD